MGCALKDLLSMTRDQLKLVKKDDLITMVLAAGAVYSSMPASSTEAAMQDALSSLRACTTSFEAQATALSDQVQLLQGKLDSMPQPVADPASDGMRIHDGPTQSVADVVAKALRTTLDDERFKTELIISNVNEGENDSTFVSDLCSTIDCRSVPQEISRLGRKLDNHPRLLKVTFPTEFDARAFKSRFDQKKRESAELPSIRVRPSRNPEERIHFAKAAKVAKELNDQAKNSGASFSFSLRDNLEIWKFQKSSDGKWKRVKDWKPPTEGPQQGPENLPGNE
jgi:hypothetical protein